MRHFFSRGLHRLSLLVLFFFGFFTALASPDYTEVYHPHINRAELALAQKNYETALDLYQQAFAAVPSPFAKDYFNAAVCATHEGNEKLTYAYLEKLALKGVDLEYLKKQRGFKPLQESKKWRKFERKYPRYRKNYRQHVNLDLRADLDELYARDQYFRQAKGGLRAHIDTLRKIEAANVGVLLRAIEKHGYPGENQIGVGDTLELLPRFAIVIERQTRFMDGYDFTKILQEAVQQGRLAPHAAAYLMEKQGFGDYKTRALVKISCGKPKDCENDKRLPDLSKFMKEKLSETQEENINEQRLDLGLESLKDYRRKVLFSLTQQEFNFNYPGAVAYYIAPSNEAAHVLTERLETIEEL
ncbi:hypothetical protein FVR03_15675 [Pontibacter qinzhouensis]|uniref:Tetratricopeptide repeat protein n=1 Tax=Pontibacter qinzhouensis TaxID=2603253 RepID=A0A5C8JIR4_9BACT|nr:hypothetical protein [Pontibacter qinzhouensis]TXK37241.1 hypothetical protein FVR03_15675 [Pontibacter qinzhouensis]